LANLAASLKAPAPNGVPSSQEAYTAIKSGKNTSNALSDKRRRTSRGRERLPFFYPRTLILKLFRARGSAQHFLSLYSGTTGGHKSPG
jgi:hypothetical protein